MKPTDQIPQEDSGLLEELAEVVGHGSEIVRNENSILAGGNSQHFWI